MSASTIFGPPPKRIDFAVVTALEEELDAVQKIFGLSESELENQLVPEDRHYYYGRVESKSGIQRSVACACCRETSNVPATTLPMEMLIRWKPTNIIMNGIAGGVALQDGSPTSGREGLSLGDVVVHNSLVYYEKSGPGSSARDIMLQPSSPSLGDHTDRIVRTGSSWHSSIVTPRPDGDARPPKCLRGQVLSGDKLLDDPDSPILNQLLKAYPKAVAVDMESGAVGHAAWEKSSELHLQFLVVRGISDFCNQKGNKAVRERWKIYAARAAASFLHKLISELPLREDDVTGALYRIPDVYQAELPRFAKGSLEETWPSPPEVTSASPPAQALLWIEYWRQLNRIEFEPMQRYSAEKLVVGYKPHPLSILYQGEFSEDQVNVLKVEGFYEPPAVVREWDGESHELLSFVWEDPLVRAKKWENAPVSVRLAGWKVEGNTLMVSLQKADYDDYLRTNLAINLKRRNDFLVDFLQPGGPQRKERLFPVEAQVCCNIVGINCMVRSSEGKFLIRQRSAEVTNAKKMYAPPVSGGMRLEGDVNWDSPSIFDSARTHLKQEMAFNEESLKGIKLVHIGMTREFARGGQTDGHFLVKSNSSLYDLLQQARKAPHKEEFLGQHESPSGSELWRFLDHPSSSPALRGSIYLLLNSASREEFLFK